MTFLRSPIADNFQSGFRTLNYISSLSIKSFNPDSQHQSLRYSSFLQPRSAAVSSTSPVNASFREAIRHLLTQFTLLSICNCPAVAISQHLPPSITMLMPSRPRLNIGIFKWYLTQPALVCYKHASISGPNRRIHELGIFRSCWKPIESKCLKRLRALHANFLLQRENTWSNQDGSRCSLSR